MFFVCHRLSADLYDTAAHFLWEFLQNADDNDYDPRVIPWLQLTYDSTFLRVDCNEVGFTADNVEAICTIRGSTKSGHNHIGRTGEKGIGFKSVFKIADVVWISSREFSFKFDKNIDFGIIAPIWERFPRPVLEKHTSYLLHLDKNCDEDQMIENLRNFDHTCLLFLRRLRQITLNIAMDGQLQTIEIRRRDGIDENGSVTIIEMGERKFKYMTIKQTVDNLPREVKRIGVGSSELILAFPLHDTAKDDTETAAEKDQKRSSEADSGDITENRPQRKAEETPGRDSEETSPKETIFKQQNVHAVLPVGQYGFKVNSFSKFQGEKVLTFPVHRPRRLSPHSQ